MPPVRPFLLDTNVVVAVLRAGPLAHVIERRYRLRSSRVKPLISIVSVGELYAFARKRDWTQTQIDRLWNLLHELSVQDISDGDTLRAYAEIDYYSEANGCGLGKNDLWIAATARATSTRLLTTDKDFLRVQTEVSVEWIDPASREAS